ncbi:MAG: sigma-54 dependent transcriptional regulator [Deltaproteobacteria bacterium]
MGSSEYDGLGEETRDPQLHETPTQAQRVVTLTILLHPQAERIGETASTDPRTPIRLGRIMPTFTPAEGGAGGPLADAFVSRRPLVLERSPSGDVAIARDGSSTRLEVDGVVLEERMTIEAARLHDGVVLTLGGSTVLLLRESEALGASQPALGLVGASAAMHALRREILRVAPSNLPVLLRGATGTGKEHVARALHARGPSPDGPFVAANMAAVQPSLAASTLFGHTKGAFTGADADRVGLFERADGGTLFLDEIGEAPPEVQVMLLRVLETGTLEPVGGGAERRVDVRLVAATDADLGRLTQDGSFRPALLHRLSGYEIHLPLLAERREDIGRLARHFWGEREGFLPTPVMERLARYAWPGNVRQLANVVSALALFDPTATAAMLAKLDAVLDTPQAVEAPPAPTRAPQELTDDDVFAAMKAEAFRIERAAERLGISRPALYRRIEEHPELRIAKQLTREEIEAAGAKVEWDLNRMSDALRVSKSGVRQRMKQLGVTPP